MTKKTAVRRILSLTLTAQLLLTAALTMSGCGLALPFDLPFGNESAGEETTLMSDGLHPGVDDGMADEALTKPESAANSETAQQAGSDTAQSDAGAGEASDSGLDDSGDAAAGAEESEDRSDEEEETITLFKNPADAQLGTTPLLYDEDAETVYVTAIGANVRRKAGTDSEIIGVVRRGMSLLRYSESDGWSEVRYAGERAFISSELLSDERPVTIKSSHDEDGDGIDDQTEILKNARAYAATRPIYESRYYDNGYPDDGYGVCSDIVAFAMRDAGYDLRALLAADIAAAPGAYTEIKKPDSKIDFRRVVNLQVYFERHFISKTTDLTQYNEWQGGDIVFFDHHIAVVSDRRNEDGVPYIIHHRSKSQISYEEDYFKIRSDIKGHFRISE